MRICLALLIVTGCAGGIGEDGTEPAPQESHKTSSPRSSRVTSDPGKAARASKAAPVAKAAEAVAEVLAYPLDRVSRKVPISGKVSCPPVELVRYRGDAIRYHKAARVYKGFIPHLKRFEEIAKEVAIEVYGRAPTQLRHNGAYYCRRIGTWPYLVSEHGLGNALDVEGFSFPRLSAGQSPEVPKRWRGAFRVSLGRHWTSTRAKDAEHRRFFRLLARRVIDEEGLFRVILGPADPSHGGHFHFDMAQHRIVNVF